LTSHDSSASPSEFSLCAQEPRFSGGTRRRRATAAATMMPATTRTTVTTPSVSASASATVAARATTSRARARVRASAAVMMMTRATGTRAAVRASASSGEGARDDDGDDAARMDREAAEEARRRAEGDAYVQDKLERELRLRGKIYRAEAELDTKKEEIMDMGEQSKGNIDAEADLVRDRTSLELGMVAGELDAELAALADEAQAARERNAKVKREIEALADELLGTGKRVEKDAKPVPGSLSEMKMKAANAEAEAVDKRMKATLEETQRATTYTMVLLLLGFLGFTLAAEGSYDKLAAVVGVFALVGYQSRMEARSRSSNK
jgi:hypothetical protein